MPVIKKYITLISVRLEDCVIIIPSDHQKLCINIYKLYEMIKKNIILVFCLYCPNHNMVRCSIYIEHEFCDVVCRLLNIYHIEFIMFQNALSSSFGRIIDQSRYIMPSELMRPKVVWCVPRISDFL